MIDITAAGFAAADISAGEEDDRRHDEALAALGQVWDPELGLDVVSLGLVYDVRADGDAVDIDMTLTTPGCPVSEQLPAEAEQAVRDALPGVQVTVHVVWDPPWTPERLTPMALEQLGFTGRGR
jgi:metal-sulfur cluster biosynthetic enzyme